MPTLTLPDVTRADACDDCGVVLPISEIAEREETRRYIRGYALCPECHAAEQEARDDERDEARDDWLDQDEEI